MKKKAKLVSESLSEGKKRDVSRTVGDVVDKAFEEVPKWLSLTPDDYFELTDSAKEEVIEKSIDEFLRKYYSGADGDVVKIIKRSKNDIVAQLMDMLEKTRH